MITESQMIEHLQRMVSIYLESYPEDKESMTRFMRWALNAWGYSDGNS